MDSTVVATAAATATTATPDGGISPTATARAPMATDATTPAAVPSTDTAPSVPRGTTASVVTR